MAHKDNRNCKPLNLVYPSTVSEPVEILVQFALSDTHFHTLFDVYSGNLNVNKKLSKRSSQKGLWDWDVVELFVTTTGMDHYLEFQVSPLNQYFELKIFEPRKRFAKRFRSDFVHSAHIHPGVSWSVEFGVPREVFGFEKTKEDFFGNAFACLGAEPNRQYYSLFLPQQEKPDFHLPNYFQKLL